AAVDCRNKKRRQRLARARVIPIIKLAAAALERSDAVERLMQMHGQFLVSYIAEIIGGEVRGELQPEISRGGAFGSRRRILLHIVGRQPVIFRRGEVGEIAPGAERYGAEEVGIGSFRVGAGGPAVQPGGDQ